MTEGPLGLNVWDTCDLSEEEEIFIQTVPDRDVSWFGTSVVLVQTLKDFLNLILSLLQWAFPSNQHCGFVWVSNNCPDQLTGAIQAHCCTLQVEPKRQQSRKLDTHLQKEDVASTQMWATWLRLRTSRVVASRGRAGEKDSSNNISVPCLFFSTCKFVPYTLK